MRVHQAANAWVQPLYVFFPQRTHRFDIGKVYDQPSFIQNIIEQQTRLPRPDL